MNRFFGIFLIIFLLTGCSTLQGMKSINIGELKNENQSIIEKNLVKNTSLEKQNISISSSILITIKNLKQLQNELNNLNRNIENISKNLEEIKSNQTNNPETVQYLDYLNSLINQSNQFVNSLYDSTSYWSKYLNKSYEKENNLDFTNDSENQNIVDSIVKPLKSFD